MRVVAFGSGRIPLLEEAGRVPGQDVATGRLIKAKPPDGKRPEKIATNEMQRSCYDAPLAGV
jgi:hypothetical protein